MPHRMPSLPLRQIYQSTELVQAGDASDLSIANETHQALAPNHQPYNERLRPA